MTHLMIALALASATSPTQDMEDTVRVSADVSIGVTEGADEYTFGMIGGIVQDERGRILVTDNRLTRIQVYDSLGRYLKTIGQMGRGPGELLAPIELALLGDGRMVVADVGFDAYLWFDERDRPIARTPRPHGERFARDRVKGDGRGHLMDARRSWERADSSFYILRFDLDSSRHLTIDSISIAAVPETLVGSAEFGSSRPPFGDIRVPFAPHTTWAPIPGGVAYSRDGRYVIEGAYFHGEADTLLFRPDLTGAAIPPDVSASALRPIVSYLRTRAEGLGVPANSWLDGVETPARFAPVIRIFMGPAGRLWVLSGGPRGGPVFDVWTTDGSLFGSLALVTGEWPDLDTIAIGRTHVLGKFLLESGAEVVQGFPIPAHLR